MAKYRVSCITTVSVGRQLFENRVYPPESIAQVIETQFEFLFGVFGKSTAKCRYFGQCKEGGEYMGRAEYTYLIIDVDVYISQKIFKSEIDGDYSLEEYICG